VVAYGNLNTKGNFKLLALKVVMVAYERLPLTRGFKYSEYSGHLQEVVTIGGSTVSKTGLKPI